MNPLIPHLLLAVLLFAVGLAGALARRNAILALVGIELMLNGANLSFVVFWRFGPNPDPQTGLMFCVVLDRRGGGRGGGGAGAGVAPVPAPADHRSGRRGFVEGLTPEAAWTLSLPGSG
jgi:NADH:ubiquinone oxidoreductase subunit K